MYSTILGYRAVQNDITDLGYIKILIMVKLWPADQNMFPFYDSFNGL